MIKCWLFLSCSIFISSSIVQVVLNVPFLYADLLIKDYNFDQKFTLSVVGSTGLVLSNSTFYILGSFFQFDLFTGKLNI